MSQFPNALPGLGSSLTLTPRTLFIQNTSTTMDFLPGGKIIDGYATRDPDNTINVAEIRPGLLLGAISLTGTSSGAATAAQIGLLGASVIGTLTTAITNASNVTLLTLTLVGATELVRRVGTAGTLVLTGSPTAGGTVVNHTMAFSAVALGTTTGSVTITNYATAFVAGSFIGANDGTAIPTTFYCGDLYSLRVTDVNNNNAAVPLRLVDCGTKVVKTGNIVNYPAAANTGLISYLKAKLRIPVPGMAFDDDF